MNPSLKLLAAAFLTLLTHSASASTPPSSCAPGDTSCPIPQNLKWECGSVHRLVIESDRSGQLRGDLGLGSVYGENSIQANLTCGISGHSTLCRVETSSAQVCNDSGCKFDPWVPVGTQVASVNNSTGEALIVGIDQFKSQLNPAPIQWPLTLACKTRAQVIQEKIRPHVCENESLRVVSYFSLGLQNFYVVGKSGQKDVSCQGQMFSSAQGKSDFVIGRSVNCPFDFAQSNADESALELSCDHGACKASTLKCKPQL